MSAFEQPTKLPETATLGAFESVHISARFGRSRLVWFSGLGSGKLPFND
jgi:hypothetical protein